MAKEKGQKHKQRSTINKNISTKIEKIICSNIKIWYCLHYLVKSYMSIERNAWRYQRGHQKVEGQTKR